MLPCDERHSRPLPASCAALARAGMSGGGFSSASSPIAALPARASTLRVALQAEQLQRRQRRALRQEKRGVRVVFLLRAWRDVSEVDLATDGANHCAVIARAEPRTAPALIITPARRGKHYVAATTRRRTRNDGSEERRSARTMESERSELAELNKMKEFEILNELKIESNTMTNPLDSRRRT